MRAPGVEIRPIHQIDGGRHFNEIFFTDVRIPHDWLLGEYNNGWRQATAMLMYERVAIGSAGAGKISQPWYKMLRDIATAAGRIDDPVVRDQLMEIYCMETTKSLVAMRTRAEMKAGKAPGPGGSLGKLYGSVIMWRFREIAMEIAGAGAMAWDEGDAAGAALSTPGGRLVLVEHRRRAPTRSSATSSATACSVYLATSASTPESRSRS